MIPLATPNLRGNEARYLQECIESTFVSSVGPFVDRFEALVADRTETSAAVATNSGTTALHLALTSVGVGRDDLVILPSFTFIASANAIAHCGADPWLFDIQLESWCLDPELLSKTLADETEWRDGALTHSASGRRVAAILPVFTLGMPADMDPIVATARRYGLPIIADAAAALGAGYRGRPVGQTGADLTVFSFNGNKTVTSGGGGIVAGDDQDLIALARHLSTTARVGSDYHHDQVGFNYRMTNLQAAVGCAQIEQLEAFVAAKRRIRGCYDAAFADSPRVEPFPRTEWADSACWFSGIVLRDAGTEDVASMRQALRDAGIDARPFWKPIHLQPPFAAAPSTRQRKSERLWWRVLTLPCSTHLTDSEQDQVISAVRTALVA